MNSRKLEGLLERLAVKFFYKDSPIDPFSANGFYIRFIALMHDVQAEFNSELTSSLNVRQTAHDLLQLLDEIGIDQPRFRDYLNDTISYLQQGGASDSVDRDSWRLEVLSASTLRIPGMLYPDTMRYYKWLARSHNSGGEIVDLGPWMGLSTCCLAEGLKLNPSRGDSRVHAFDRFKWESWMSVHCMDSRYRPVFKEGESFCDQFMSFCGPLSDIIRVHHLSLPGTPDEATQEDVQLCGRHVGVIIFDCSDSYGATEAMWRMFEPYFVTNNTVVVFNQFGNARSEGIRAFCCDRRDRLKPVHKPTGSAKGFVYMDGLTR